MINFYILDTTIRPSVQLNCTIGLLWCAHFFCKMLNCDNIALKCLITIDIPRFLWYNFTRDLCTCYIPYHIIMIMWNYSLPHNNDYVVFFIFSIIASPVFATDACEFLRFPLCKFVLYSHLRVLRCLPV